MRAIPPASSRTSPHMSRPDARHAPGFTLVELLVALAIFALIAAFAYRGLDALLQSRVALDADARKWRDASIFVGRIERDVAAALSRGATGESGTVLAPLSSSIPASGPSD